MSKRNARLTVKSVLGSRPSALAGIVLAGIAALAAISLMGQENAQKLSLRRHNPLTHGMVCRIVYMNSAEIAEGNQRLPSGANNLVAWILRKSNRRAFHKGAAELFRELRNGPSV